MPARLSDKDLNVKWLHVRFIDPDEPNGMKRFKVGTIHGRRATRETEYVVVRHTDMLGGTVRDIAVPPEDVFIYTPTAREDC